MAKKYKKKGTQEHSQKQLVSQPRPQRNAKAKIVFDPSDLHVPKKRKKRSDKSTGEKSESPPNGLAGSTVKDPSTVANNELSDELFNVSLNKPVATCWSSKLSDPPSRCATPKTRPEALTFCSLCKEDTSNKQRELVACPFCLIKVHSDCIVINEPMWRFKIDQCPWSCIGCRDKYCTKCHKGESESDTFYRCITCFVSMHIRCYESYNVKPLHPLKLESHVCIPCMTLATESVPEVEEDDKEVIEMNFKSDSSIKSEVDADGAPDLASYCSGDDSVKSPPIELDCPIPDVSGWNSFKIYQYLSFRGIPETVTKIILDNDIDGKAIMLLQRTDITREMGLKLGPALKLYKEVRILQTRSTNTSSYWE